MLFTAPRDSGHPGRLGHVTMTTRENRMSFRLILSIPAYSYQAAMR